MMKNELVSQYNTLHYTKLYLSESEENFVPWKNHVGNWHRFESINSDEKRGNSQFSYSKIELIDYSIEIDDCIETGIHEDYFNQQCGFDWMKMSRFELHLYNLRHLQHHTGQLTERLQQNKIQGIPWVDKSSQ